MKRLAHRGYSQCYPENTMLAFIKAIEKGFDGIETDVHLTKDNYLVLCHDETINRTSNGSGYIKDLTLKELRQYNYNNGMDVTCDIPLLSDLLKLIQNKKILVNLEIKTDAIHYTDIEEKIVNMVHEYQVDHQILYSSFYLPSLLKVKEMNHKAYTGYLFDKDTELKVSEAVNHQLSAIHPRYNLVDKRLVEQMHSYKMLVSPWTVPDLKEYERLKALESDYCISNDYFGENNEIR